jgi:hypothetical protein
VWAAVATVVAIQRGGATQASPEPNSTPVSAARTGDCAPCSACPACSSGSVRASGGDLARAAPPHIGPCVCPSLPSDQTTSDPKELKYADRCEAGDVDACRHAESLALDNNPARALRYVSRACNLGDWRSCESVGFSLVEGRGAAPDRARGLELLRAACDAGQCFYLGLTQRRDAPTEGLAAYSQCCSKRQAICCTGAGGISEDLGEFQTAAEWYRAACDLGRVEGCEKLIALMEKGLLGAVTPEQLTELRKRSCSVGDLKSCDKLKQ